MKLDIACAPYDHVRPLLDGTVGIEGVDARFHTARIVTEIFEGMVRRRAYHVSELGMTYFLRTMEDGGQPFVALPVFPNRAFRHSAIFINKNAGIRTPADLNGRRIGELALYGHDSGIISKGILADEFGFRPETCRWVIGRIDFPMKPIDFVPQPHPPGVEVAQAPGDADLGEMLEAGEIDALFSADIPGSVIRKSPEVGRLFENYVPMERDYHRRTGIFPLMHAIVVTRELAEREPETVRTIYHSFCRARETTLKQLVAGMTFNNMFTPIPWLVSLIETNRELLGDDWFPYGFKANAKAIDAILRYHHEQGITERRFTPEEIFVPYLLDT